MFITIVRDFEKAVKIIEGLNISGLDYTFEICNYDREMLQLDGEDATYPVYGSKAVTGTNGEFFTFVDFNGETVRVSQRAGWTGQLIIDG